jgi:hypothetical protein
MSLRTSRRTVLGCLGCLAASAALAAAVIGAYPPQPAKAAENPKSDPALERTREQVRMLDDLYKNAVVSITKRYVDSQDNQPAIMVAKELFSAMNKQGWHSARLVDATGDPINDGNSPRTDFEKEAYEVIRSGKPYYEKVVGDGSNRRLLAATVVPVVMQKCAECHVGKKSGEVLGFLRYDVPVK